MRYARIEGIVAAKGFASKRDESSVEGRQLSARASLDFWRGPHAGMADHLDRDDSYFERHVVGQYEYTQVHDVWKRTHVHLFAKGQLPSLLSKVKISIDTDVLSNDSVQSTNGADL